MKKSLLAFGIVAIYGSAVSADVSVFHTAHVRGAEVGVPATALHQARTKQAASGLTGYPSGYDMTWTPMLEDIADAVYHDRVGVFIARAGPNFDLQPTEVPRSRRS